MRRLLRANWRFVVAVLLVGASAGLVGVCLVSVLGVVEWLAWGLAPGQEILTAIDASGWTRRVLVLLLAGALGGTVWWGMARARRGPVPLAAAIAGEDLPLGRTALHVVTQVAIVGAGVSIGKEVAPRELSAAVGGWLSRLLRLDRDDRSILLAAAAGAGLAAVYAVPLSGIAFVMEILLVKRSWRGALAAVGATGAAFAVSQPILRLGAYYAVPTVEVGPSLIVFGLLAGPAIGAAGLGMAAAVRRLGTRRTPRWWPLAALPLAAGATGVVAIWVPQVLGNGHSVAQFAFDGDGSAGLASATVLIGMALVKATATLATIGAGAWGGVLNPSVAVGAALGSGIGLLWSTAFPGSSLAGFGLVGAAVFLSVVQRSPVTAVLLVAEFTHSVGPVLVPIVLGVAGAGALRLWWERARPRHG